MASETTRIDLELADTPVETLAEGLYTCIQEYELQSLSLEYERKDDFKAKTASFSFWLTGEDAGGRSYMLLELRELPQDWPAFTRQLQETTSESGISFHNSFEEDGYEIDCQIIQRRIWRQK